MKSVIPVCKIPEEKSDNRETVSVSVSRNEKQLDKDNNFHSIYEQMMSEEYMDTISVYDGVDIAELAEKGKVFG